MMSPDHLQHAHALLRSVLYEGYLLYPYRQDALKNRFRMAFGSLFPQAWVRHDQSGERCAAGCDVLIAAPPETIVQLALFFLQTEDPAPESDETAAMPGATEQSVAVPPTPISTLLDKLVLEQRVASTALMVRIQLAATQLEPNLFRLAIDVSNQTPVSTGERHTMLSSALAAASVLLSVDRGALISRQAPPAKYAQASELCRQDGLWPVLIGQPNNPTDGTDGKMMLAAPIILYDFAELAPESPGEFFDSTEIDELLVLRVLTLTDYEKQACRQADPKTAALLDRVDRLAPNQLAQLHGRLRHTQPVDNLRVGAQVRLQPRGRNDVFDIALAGRTATISAIEVDFEGRRHVAVTIDDDPGRDLGEAGIPGHRFYFGIDEVHPL